jgi:hypothetical protein
MSHSTMYVLLLWNLFHSELMLFRSTIVKFMIEKE